MVMDVITGAELFFLKSKKYAITCEHLFYNYIHPVTPHRQPVFHPRSESEQNNLSKLLKSLLTLHFRRHHTCISSY